MTHGGELFRLLVDSVREYAIVALDPDGRVVSWNRGAVRIEGYAAEEIVGRHFSLFYPPEDALAGKPEAALRAAAEQGSHVAEGWRVRKDGTRFWASVVLTALRDETGRLTGFAKVSRDLTEARRAEQLDRRLSLLGDALRRRDEFLAVASHELRTPLTCVQLELQALLRYTNLGAALPPAQRARLGRLERHVLRLSRLVASLLDVTALASGGVAIERTPFDLGELVREVAARARAADPRSRISLSLDGPHEGRCDRRRVDGAISSLVENAQKNGGGCLELSVRGDASAVRVAVRDHGPGIAPELQASVFDRFGRAAPVEHFGGFGVGLWRARQIAAAHGGALELESAPGRGATFTLVLPRSARAQDAAAPSV
jgi:PAS domain S-box-containing protein